MLIPKYQLQLNSDKTNSIVKEAEVSYFGNKLEHPQNVMRLFNETVRLGNLSEEYAYILAMDIKCNPLGISEISHGTIDTSLVSPREIFIRLLLMGAASFVFVHNHPSQDTTPSEADVCITRRLYEVSQLINISLLDHIVVSRNDYFSFRENQIVFQMQEQ